MGRITKSVRRLRREFLKNCTQMVTAAFALVAALAWNTTIAEIIKKYLKPGKNLSSWLIYALIVTFIAAMVSFYLGSLSARIKKEEEEEKKREEENSTPRKTARGKK